MRIPPFTPYFFFFSVLQFSLGDVGVLVSTSLTLLEDFLNDFVLSDMYIFIFLHTNIVYTFIYVLVCSYTDTIRHIF